MDKRVTILLIGLLALGAGSVVRHWFMFFQLGKKRRSGNQERMRLVHVTAPLECPEQKILEYMQCDLGEFAAD